MLKDTLHSRIRCKEGVTKHQYLTTCLYKAAYLAGHFTVGKYTFLWTV